MSKDTIDALWYTTGFLVIATTIILLLVIEGII